MQDVDALADKKDDQIQVLKERLRYLKETKKQLAESNKNILCYKLFLDLVVQGEDSSVHRTTHSAFFLLANAPPRTFRAMTRTH